MRLGLRARTPIGSASGNRRARGDCPRGRAAGGGIRAAGPADVGETCRGLGPSIGAFLDDEGGYTTVAVAVALLVSLSLVFSAASAQWVMSRSAEVQNVADAAAEAGVNAVAAYTTIAQALDACVLSMGLTGMVVCGAGLVASCVPALAAAGVKLTASGAQILDARRSFSRSAAEGLKRLESVLPSLVIYNSAACVLANSEEAVSYAGCAIPYPQESASDFSALEADADDSGLEELAGSMRDLAQEERAAKERADDAKRRGWLADCGSSPYCMWQRADTLAGLGGSENPYYPDVASWTFGAPLERARAYYAARLSACSVGGTSPEQLTDDACRRAFYEYALAEVGSGSYSESADGSVSIDLPSLPHNTDETRATRLYTDAVWPCSAEEGGAVLHSSLSCPGAQGAYAGDASLADLEAGGVLSCDECRMDIGDLGKTAAASTSIENGFEHWWREAVEASREYERARNEEVDAKARLKQKAKEGADVFKKAIESLSAVRPSLCPPGAWGCVAVVVRPGGSAVPSELTAAFISSAELPAGAAVSAATLAPDSSTAENNVLASFFDGISQGSSLAGSLLDGVATLWGKLLVGYGSAYESVASAGGGFLDKLDGVLGGSVGSWLKGKLKQVMEGAGLAPADMRLRKPVLVNTSDVLSKAGLDRESTVRSLLAKLPDSGSAGDYVRAFGAWALDTYGDEDFTVAELTVPGTQLKIPLKVNLKALAGAL